MEKVSMRFDARELDVRYDPSRVSPDAMFAAIKGLQRGFEPTAGAMPDAEAKAEALSDEEKAGLDIRVVSKGEAVRFADHVAPGKVTLFDYYAEWCGPCKILTPKLERMVKDTEDVALRKIDIIDWKSAAARQATEEFRMPGVPHVRVFGPDGEHVGDVNGNDIDAIRALVEKAR